MNTLCALVFAVIAAPAFAADTIRFEYENAPVQNIIADYAKASGQRFVIDPNVKGTATIINPTKITVDEAFNQLSTALAANGLAISKQGDMMMVSGARQIQRSLIDVTSELPALKPEKMVTYVINLKFANADEVNRQIRILPSKDGELVPYQATNQLLVTDWVSNLHRIAKIVTQIDRPGRASARAGLKAGAKPVAATAASDE